MKVKICTPRTTAEKIGSCFLSISSTSMQRPQSNVSLFEFKYSNLEVQQCRYSESQGSSFSEQCARSLWDAREANPRNLGLSKGLLTLLFSMRGLAVIEDFGTAEFIWTRLQHMTRCLQPHSEFHFAARWHNPCKIKAFNNWSFPDFFEVPWSCFLMLDVFLTLFGLMKFQSLAMSYPESSALLRSVRARPKTTPPAWLIQTRHRQTWQEYNEQKVTSKLFCFGLQKLFISKCFGPSKDWQWKFGVG